MDNVKNTPAPSGKNQRPCPALKGFLLPPDCGTQRGSKWDCPADCPFYPFAISGYDSWLKLDESWGRKAMAYVDRHFGRGQFQQLLGASLPSTEDGKGGEILAFSHALYTTLFFQRDPAGRTLADRWEAEGWTGLNNDERVMMRHRRHSFVTVVEVHKVLDLQSALCTDALAPGSPPFVLVDRSTTPRMVRFTRLLGWITHYPHFSHLGGVGLVVAMHLWPYWKEVIDNRLAAEQARQPGMTLRELLTRDFVWTTDMLADLGLDYRQRIFNSLDLHQCVATYKIVGSIHDVAAILRSKPDFEPQDAGADDGLATPLAEFVWVRRGESAELSKSLGGQFDEPSQTEAVGTVGNVRLFQDKLVIKVFSKKKHAFARRMVDKFFGPLVRFDSESIVDMAKMQALKEPEVKVSREVAEVMDKAFSGRDKPRFAIDASLQHIPAPESALTASGDEPGPPPNKPALLEETLQRHFRSLLEERIPMLEGRTPRESARDPALRPLLLEWTKGLIHQVETNNRRDGTSISLDWILDELGLTELK